MCVYMLRKCALCCGGRRARRHREQDSEMGNDPSKRLLSKSLPQPLTPPRTPRQTPRHTPRRTPPITPQLTPIVTRRSLSKADFKVMWDCTLAGLICGLTCV